MAILVSGGAGYIGSHTCIELLNAGYDIVVADNYYNASPVVLDRVKQITGKDFRFYKADMTAARMWRRSSPSARTSPPSSSLQPTRLWARACPSPSSTTIITSTARWSFWT